jgi:hypothetical protein
MEYLAGGSCLDLVSCIVHITLRLELMKDSVEAWRVYRGADCDCL